ncbi:MAG: single-stranded DNA-binding protein [Anaerolineaceae bacterium]|nr:single-stranded DNA-binding protein [Anaerolineaceae bacterium]
MNKWQGIGRLTKDAVFKVLQSGKAVASFTLAVNRRKRDDGADFIQCVAWEKTAELIEKYVKKGHRIGVTGHIQTRTYEKQDGTKGYATEVVVEELEFLEKREQDQTHQEPVRASDEKLEEVEDFDLPF